MRIVDPHIHLWDLDTGLYPGLETPSTSFIGDNTAIARTYALDELLGEGADDGIELAKMVHVEAIASDPIAETRWLQALADVRGLPQGLVAGIDLSADDVEDTLARQNAFANVRGVRQILNWHEDPALRYVETQFMAQASWRRGFGLLAKFGLSFDLQLYPQQMPAAAALAGEHPETAIIVNHAGMCADRNLSGWRAWRDGMRALAAHDNVAVKISGLGMFDHTWSVESIRPYVLETIDAFGVGRVMFASNFPVDKLFSTYGALWQAFAAIIADFSDDEKAACLAGNAERIYRI